VTWADGKKRGSRPRHHSSAERVRSLEAALRGTVHLIEAWSNGPLFKNAGVIWPEGGCQAPALLEARLVLTPETPADPDDAPALTGEELHRKDGVFRIGGKVVSREEGLATFQAALKTECDHDQLGAPYRWVRSSDDGNLYGESGQTCSKCGAQL
jgi:hypothetical protein